MLATSQAIRILVNLSNNQNFLQMYKIIKSTGYVLYQKLQINSKISKIMKLSVLIFIFFGLSLSASTYSQTHRLSVDKINVTIAEVFSDIEAMSEFSFLYSPREIDVTRKVSIKATNVLITDILSSILAGNDIAYRLTDRHIILYKADTALGVVDFKLQGIAVTGTVTDETGEGLPGVNVSVQGTLIGVITDTNGKYSITVPSTDAVLVFSFVGFATQEFRVGSQTVVDIVLVEDSRQIEEVVVVGYGTQKRSNITGSVTSVKPEAYRDMGLGVTNVLQGRVAGVYVTNNQIIIRGAASINGSDPLWIVDGIPGGAPNFDDIESIEVLKDGASIAIYGALGAGGVILVTTKHGNPGKTQVNFRANWGSQMPLYIPKMLHTADYIDRKLASGYSMPQNSGWENPNSLPDTQWNDMMWGNAFRQNYLIQVSGGNEKNVFNITADYHDDKNVAILHNSGNKGGGIRAAMEQRLNKRIKLTEILSGGYGTDIPSYYRIEYRQLPNMLVYDPTNLNGGWGKLPSYFNGGNPAAEVLTRHYDNKSYGANAHFIFDYTIIDGLHFQANFAGSFNGESRNFFQEAYNVGANAKQASFEKEYSSGNSARMFYTLTYDHTFAEKHYLKAMAGYEASRGHGSSAKAQIDDFPVKVAEDIRLGTGRQYAGGDVGNDRGLSQFFRLNYAYDSKYMLEGSIRRDGYDNFGSDNRFGLFPSVSAGWNLHRESFIADNANYISQLKLRTSYGVIGNNTIDKFLYEASFTNDRQYYSYDNANQVSRAFIYGKFPNTSIKWEQVAQFDLGLDVGLLNNRLNFSVEYYTKKTTDMLYWISLPHSSGSARDNYPANIGEISNKGFDFMIQYRENRRDFRYDVAFTMSTNNNKVIKLSDEINPLIWKGGSWTFDGPQFRTENGKPMGQMYGYLVEGIFQNQAEVDGLNASAPKDDDGNQFYQVRGTASGDFKYKDVNGDGAVTDQDKEYIGNPWPKLLYGININLSWKGFDLNMGWVGNYKFDIYNIEKAYARNFYGDYSSTYKVYDAWSTNNSASNHPRVINGDPNGNFRRHSSYFVEDGSFLKLRTLHFGYNLPSSLLEKVKIQGLKLYVNCNNLLTITKFDGNPEIGGGYLERNAYSESRFPATRSVVGGISLTF